ncbi:basic salivary proline-rich protein 1-like [Schistocerca americana]|uniref:basic salivary proline-rich protein 1-like n=1 Tax=Schistocerca americana TaxID=7009 RepID=UPI001F4F3C7C|nr:basic salivary proline-rich protein 1-like [Schistocerca americana]
MHPFTQPGKCNRGIRGMQLICSVFHKPFPNGAGPSGGNAKEARRETDGAANRGPDPQRNRGQAPQTPEGPVQPPQPTNAEPGPSGTANRGRGPQGPGGQAPQNVRAGARGAQPTNNAAGATGAANGSRPLCPNCRLPLPEHGKPGNQKKEN